MSSYKSLILGIAAALMLAACATEGELPADDLHVVSPDKADDYYSNVAAEFEISGVLPVAMTEEQFNDEEQRQNLATRRVTAYGLYLTAYLTAKFEGIDHNDDGQITDDEILFHNMGYGDFSAMVRNGTAEDMAVSGDAEAGYSTTFTIDVAGPRGLMDMIPRAQGVPASVNELVFDLRMPAGASIDESNVPRREFRRFDPDEYEGELETVRGTMRPLPNVSNTYPQYAAFTADGLYDLTLFFGHDYNESRSDLREAREAFRTLGNLGFTSPANSFDELTHESGPFVREARANGRAIVIEVRIFHSDMFVDNRRVQHDLALSEIVARDVFFYNGHAGPYFGFYLDEAREATVNYWEFADAPFQPDRQQLVIAQGCQTYSNYADMLYAHRDKSELNLDVITTVNYSYGQGTMGLLRNLIRLDSNDNHQPTDYYRMIANINSDWLNNMRDVFYGVMGITENPQLHPYASLETIGASCEHVDDCGDANGNVCLATIEGGARTCGAATLNGESCPEGTEFRELASGTSVTGGACFVVSTEPVGNEYTYASTSAAQPIPDNDEEGISDTITVPDLLTIEELRVELDITHTYRGDLVVELERAGRTVTVVSRDGGSQDDLHQSFTIADFNGQDGSGDWTLRVFDRARVDTGTLDSWKLTVVTR